MKTMIALALAVSALAAATTASAAPHHGHQVCTIRHHHRVCVWR